MKNYLSQQSIRNIRITKRNVISFFIFFFVLVIYSITLPLHHTGFADSDELALSGYYLGVAHAPGYPIYILLLYIFEHFLPLNISVYSKGGFLNSVISSITLVYFFNLSLEIFSFLKIKRVSEKVKKKKYRFVDFIEEDTLNEDVKILISLGTTLSLAFSLLFWLYSIIPEVFSFNNMLITLTLFFLLKTTRYIFYKDSADSQRKRRNIVEINLCLTYIFFVLAILNLQTSVVLAPVVIPYTIYILIKLGYFKEISKKIYVYIFFIPIILYSVYSFLLYMYSKYSVAPLSWYLQPTIGNIFKYFMRENYIQASSNNAYIHAINLAEIFQQIPLYIKYDFYGIVMIPLILSLIGFIFLFFRHKRYFFLIGGSFLCASVFLPLYIGFPQDKSSLAMYFGTIATSQRQDIFGLLFIYLLAGIGVYSIFLLLKRIQIQSKIYSFNISKLIRYIFYAIVLVFPILLLIETYPQTNLRNFNSTYDFAIASINETKGNSVLICFSDISCFSDLYAEYIDTNVRKIEIIPYNNVITSSYYEKKGIKTELFNYSENPYILEDILSYNIYIRKNVYVQDLTSDYLSYLGLDGNAYYLIPKGYIYLVSDTIPKSNTIQFNYNVSKRYNQSFNTNTKNYWFRSYEDYLSKPITETSYLYWFEGNKELAIRYENEAKAYDKYITQGAYISSINEYTTKTSPLTAGDTTRTSNEDYLLALSDEGKYNSYVFPLIKFSLLRNPYNLPARVLIQKIYSTSGTNFTQVSKEEENNIKQLQKAL